jgi:hypothetical protein
MQLLSGAFWRTRVDRELAGERIVSHCIDDIVRELCHTEARAEHR